MTTWELVADSLDGLSVGDALGAQYFVPGSSVADLAAGLAPAGIWPWTDDTEMACSLVGELRDNQSLDQDRLAAAFARRFDAYRGYGGGAVVILRQIRDGTHWRTAALSAFSGQGSMGNGAAMRVAPLGALSSGDSRTAALEAVRSAEVTHAHAEGILGAVAVAVAAAEVGWARVVGHRPEPPELLDAVAGYLVPSRVLTGIERARRLIGASVAEAAYELGNGAQVLAQDTVPFALWLAASYVDDYRSAVLGAITAGGDMDTVAAIVGGIVATHTGRAGIPPDWLEHREPLPAHARTAGSSGQPHG
jgi:ADP-ribosylglycohydrolase